jgi:hypothetical protein
MGTLDPSTRRCRKCKEIKHRRFFVPRSGIKTAYDTLCNVCRNAKDKNKMPVIQLEKRLAMGLMSQRKFDKIIEERKKNKQRQRIESVTSNWRNKNMVTWEMPERSARMAMKVLNAYPYQSVEAAEWALRAKELIRQTQEEIKLRKEKEQLPTHRLLFWYDVVDGMSQKFRNLVNQYPEGPHKAPLQVL